MVLVDSNKAFEVVGELIRRQAIIAFDVRVSIIRKKKVNLPFVLVGSGIS
jgi:hypothetical protein